MICPIVEESPRKHNNTDGGDDDDSKMRLSCSSVATIVLGL